MLIRWSGELLVITHQGALTSYYLGVSDGVVHPAHTFLFTWPYAMGISTAVLVPEFNMLLLGGVTANEEGLFVCKEGVLACVYEEGIFKRKVRVFVRRECV